MTDYCRTAARLAVVASFLIGCASGAQEPAPQEPTLDDYFAAWDAREAALARPSLSEYFGDAEIWPTDALELFEAPASVTDGDASRRLTDTARRRLYGPPWRERLERRIMDIEQLAPRAAIERLPEQTAADIGALQCRLVIGAPSPTVVTALVLADGAFLRVERAYAASAFFMVLQERDVAAAACADELFTDDNVTNVWPRPDWLIERVDAGGRKVLITSSPTEGPLHDAVAALLEVVRDYAPRPETVVRYFPDLAFAKTHAFRAFDRDDDLGPLMEEERVGDDSLFLSWFSRSFAVIGHDSLYERRVDPDAAVFRMTLLPSFSGPYSVTITPRPDGGALLSYKAVGQPTDDACVEAGLADGSIRWSNDVSLMCGALRESSRALGPEEGRLLHAWFDREAFWSAPSAGRPGGLDGCHLVVEGLEEGRYHVTERWTCDHGAPPEVRDLLCRPAGDAGAQADPDVWPAPCE